MKDENTTLEWRKLTVEEQPEKVLKATYELMLVLMGQINGSQGRSINELKEETRKDRVGLLQRVEDLEKKLDKLNNPEHHGFGSSDE